MLLSAAAAHPSPNAAFSTLTMRSSAYILPLDDTCVSTRRWPLDNPPSDLDIDSCRWLEQSLDSVIGHLPDSLQAIDSMIHRALDWSTADGNRNSNHPAIKRWKHFTRDLLGIQAERPMDPMTTPLAARLEEEWLAMRFIAYLVEVVHLLPETARQYFSLFQGWHAKSFGVKLAGGLKLERLPAMLKGLKRLHAGAPRPIRRNISPEQLRCAMDRILDPSIPLHANLRAAIATAFQGLLRSAEFSGTNAANTIYRSDLKKLTRQLMILMIHPCKNMNHLSGKTCPLVIGAGGKFIDAVAEIANLLQVDPASSSDSSTPLFRDPATNKPFTYAQIHTLCDQLLRSVGLDPSEFGTHFLRISGASALFAAGANETIIRTMGRWSSDLYRVYVRACFEQTVQWTATMGSTSTHPITDTFDEVEHY